MLANRSGISIANSETGQSLKLSSPSYPQLLIVQPRVPPLRRQKHRAVRATVRLCAPRPGHGPTGKSTEVQLACPTWPGTAETAAALAWVGLLVKTAQRCPRSSTKCRLAA
jgi:hypothetical protein